MAGSGSTSPAAARLTVSAVLAVAIAGCTSTAGTETQLPAPIGAHATSGEESEPPLPAPTATPAATSGVLTAEALPPPGAIGTGWRLRVEGSDEEDGIGNGTAYQERDAREIVDAVLPMGCDRRSASPVPVNVLQATYALPSDGAFAVVLRLRFDSPEAAGAFADTLRDDLGACRSQPDDPYSGAPAPVLEAAGDTSEYQLVGESAVWVKAFRVEGSDVLTLDSDAPSTTINWTTLGFQTP